MRYAVLGTGMVGQTLATKLSSLGHEVAMGSRDAENETAVAWADQAGEGARAATFADAAGSAEVVLNATAGAHSLAALQTAGAEALSGKVLIDVANPLDMSTQPPTLTVCNDDSLGEQIQRAFPDVRVVKTLNTMGAAVMVDPGLVPGDHVVFVCGEDSDAKAQVAAMLGEFGWPAGRVVDLGGIDAARGTEMYLALWLRLWGATGTGQLNVELRVGE